MLKTRHRRRGHSFSIQQTVQAAAAAATEEEEERNKKGGLLKDISHVALASISCQAPSYYITWIWWTIRGGQRADAYPTLIFQFSVYIWCWLCEPGLLFLIYPTLPVVLNGAQKTPSLSLHVFALFLIWERASSRADVSHFVKDSENLPSSRLLRHPFDVGFPSYFISPLCFYAPHRQFFYTSPALISPTRLPPPVRSSVC